MYRKRSDDDLDGCCMRKNVVFIGMPAVGKSKVGFAVAQRLHMRFIDTDRVIEKQEQATLKELIAKNGEDGFLAIEEAVNLNLKAKNAVISPGGSVIYCKAAMEHYKETATIVYLEASYEDIRSRIQSLTKRGVVLKDGQTFRQLYEERTALYRQYAHITVNEEGCQKADTIENVLRALRKYWRKCNRERKLQRQKEAASKHHNVPIESSK